MASGTQPLKPPKLNADTMAEALPDLLEKTTNVKLDPLQSTDSFERLLGVVERWGRHHFPDAELHGEILARSERASRSSRIQALLSTARADSFRGGGRGQRPAVAVAPSGPPNTTPAVVDRDRDANQADDDPELDVDDGIPWDLL